MNAREAGKNRAIVGRQVHDFRGFVLYLLPNMEQKKTATWAWLRLSGSSSFSRSGLMGWPIHSRGLSMQEHHTLSARQGQGPELAAGAVPLGTTARKVSVSVVKPFIVNSATGEIVGAGYVFHEARALRYLLQAGARELMGKDLERVVFCHRRPSGQGSIGVHWAYEYGRAFYSGLQTCGSVWMCSVCAAKVAERRRVEIGEGIEAHTASGGQVVLFTFTVRHHRGDDLGVTLAGVRGAHKKFKQGRAYQRLRASVGLLGTISGLEVTHGNGNGWHPHIHELWFVRAGVDLGALQAELLVRWSACVERFGLRSVNSHGLKISYRATGAETLNLYMTKMGGTWDLSREIVGSATKRARGASGRSPAALLYDYTAGSDIEAGLLWFEFAKTFKGRKQIVWSKGLRAALLGSGVEETDEEIAAKFEERSIVLAVLSLVEWRLVLAHEAVAELLQVADSGDVAAVGAYLQSLGVQAAALAATA